MPSSLRLLTHASEILTGQGFAKHDGRKPSENDLGRIADGAIIDDGSKVVWVGKTKDIPKKYLSLKAKNLKLKHAITAGFVDCHTHLVFAGNRATEFAARCGGATYEQISKKGGGITRTVTATREASERELFDLGCERIREAYGFGVRTLEIKSGYGLSTECELKILHVVKKLQKKFPQMRIEPTFLGAHAFPKTSECSREDYIDEIIDQMLPRVASQKLATACDAFIDRGYYTNQEAEKIFSAAKKLGFKIKVHADELANTESAALAVKWDALSADHLLRISKKGIKALSKSQTVAVLLPGTAFYLKAQQAPAREMIDAGCKVALSTDFNPGTSMTLNLPAVMTIAALYLGMSRAELLAAVTYNAASALGLQKHKGVIAGGMDADFVVHPFSTFDELYYRFAWASH